MPVIGPGLINRRHPGPDSGSGGAKPMAAASGVASVVDNLWTTVVHNVDRIGWLRDDRGWYRPVDWNVELQRIAEAQRKPRAWSWRWPFRWREFWLHHPPAWPGDVGGRGGGVGPCPNPAPGDGEPQGGQTTE